MASGLSTRRVYFHFFEAAMPAAYKQHCLKCLVSWHFQFLKAEHRQLIYNPCQSESIPEWRSNSVGVISWYATLWRCARASQPLQWQTQDWRSSRKRPRLPLHMMGTCTCSDAVGFVTGLRPLPVPSAPLLCSQKTLPSRTWLAHIIRK